MPSTPIPPVGLLAQFADSRVLIVDSESRLLAGLALNLEAEGLRTLETASNGASALALHEQEPFDLILLDNHMPRMTGREVLRELRRRGDPVPVIMHTASSREELDLDGLELAAFIQKPDSLAEYTQAVREVLATPSLSTPTETSRAERRKALSLRRKNR